MQQRVLPRASFEERLPDGWFLSRLYKGNRILYYKDTKVASVPDDFQIESTVLNIIQNPPTAVQVIMYQEGLISSDCICAEAQKQLVKKGLVTYEFAQKCFQNISSWLKRYVPAKAVYAGSVYTNKRGRWYDQNGNCISTSGTFFSTWDARVRYAAGECTLEDVARYSWAAVLECLGDEHQRFINRVLVPKMELNRKGWAVDAKRSKQARMSTNQKWEHTEFDISDEIEADYREDVNSCLYNYFFRSIDNQVQMFTENCRVPGFEDILEKVRTYEDSTIKKLQDIQSTLARFRWDGVLGEYKPVFSPQVFTSSKRAEFFELVHEVIIGKISGHEAALRFTSGSWKKIAREQNRYRKYKVQYAPFFTERWKKLKPEVSTFQKAVEYVRKSTSDLIALGYREESRTATSFIYDGCRFVLDIDSGSVDYLGVAGGSYLSDEWLKLRPEQRRSRLNDDAEWKYQEQAIRRYRKLFSFLFNVVHKHWDKATYFIQDKLVAKKKYLRPSSGFLAKMQERADNYIKSLERRVVFC